MRVIYDGAARIELAQAYSYYEAARQGLGKAFLDEIEEAMTNVTQRPLRWRRTAGRFRRALVNRFPYGIIYSVEADEIFVIAFMHLHQKPGYWKSRGSPPESGWRAF